MENIYDIAENILFIIASKQKLFKRIESVQYILEKMRYTSKHFLYVCFTKKKIIFERDLGDIPECIVFTFVVKKTFFYV